MHTFAFFFKGPCDINNVFINYFEECKKKQCFLNGEIEFARDVPSIINNEDTCHVVRLRMRGLTAVSPSNFEFFVFENEVGEFGLEIKELKRTTVLGREVVKTSNVCRSMDTAHALEEFRSYFHIAFSRTACRRKFGNRELGYPASDEETAAAHFDAIRDIISTVSDSNEAIKEDVSRLRDANHDMHRKWTEMQATINRLSREVELLREVQHDRSESYKPNNNRFETSDPAYRPFSDDDDTRKRQRIAE